MSQLFRPGQAAVAGFVPTIGATKLITPRGGGGASFPLDPDTTVAWRFTDGSLKDLVNGLSLTHTRPSDGTYFNPSGVLKIATTDEPRFDHDPATGNTPLGIRCENARTNLFLNSGAPVTQGVTTAAAAYSISVIGPGTVTLSGTGVGVASEGSPATITCSAGTLTCTVAGGPDFVQVELGDFHSTMIITNGATATRAQDRYTTLDLSWLTPDVGTAYAKGICNADASEPTANLWQVSSGSSANYIYVIGRTNGVYRSIKRTASVSETLNSLNAYPDGVVHKTAVAWAVNDFELYVDSVRSGTGLQTLGGPDGLSQLDLGADLAGNFSWWGTIAEWGYAKVRKDNQFLEDVTT